YEIGWARARRSSPSLLAEGRGLRGGCLAARSRRCLRSRDLVRASPCHCRCGTTAPRFNFMGWVTQPLTWLLDHAAYLPPWLAVAVGYLGARGKSFGVVAGVMAGLAAIALFANAATYRDRTAQDRREANLELNFDRLRADKGDSKALEQLI